MEEALPETSNARSIAFLALSLSGLVALWSRYMRIGLILEFGYVTRLGLTDRGLERQIAPVHHIIERDIGEERVHLPADRGPQIMGTATFAPDAAFHRIPPT